MNKPALLLSLLALAALGLVACGGDGDTTTEAGHQAAIRVAEEQAAETSIPVGSPVTADKKLCGSLGRATSRPFGFAVVEGDVSCRVARGVMTRGVLKRNVLKGNSNSRLPGPWTCGGPDGWRVCVNDNSFPQGELLGERTERDTLLRWVQWGVPEGEEAIVAWCCGADRREAMTYIATGLSE